MAGDSMIPRRGGNQEQRCADDRMFRATGIGGIVDLRIVDLPAVTASTKSAASPSAHRTPWSRTGWMTGHPRSSGTILTRAPARMNMDGGSFQPFSAATASVVISGSCRSFAWIWTRVCSFRRLGSRCSFRAMAASAAWKRRWAKSAAVCRSRSARSAFARAVSSAMIAAARSTPPTIWPQSATRAATFTARPSRTAVSTAPRSSSSV